MAEFHPFPRLPSELRFWIWTLAAQQPRIVEIFLVNRYWDRDSTLERPPPTSSRDTTFVGVRTKSRTPAVLHVNRESRRECLKFFTISLGVRKIKRIIGQAYLNFASDTLLLTPATMGTVFNLPVGTAMPREYLGKDVDEITSIAVQLLFGGTAYEKNAVKLKAFLLRFRNLKHFLVLNTALRVDQIMQNDMPELQFSELEDIAAADILRKFQQRTIARAVDVAYQGAARGPPLVEMKVLANRDQWWGRRSR